MSCKMQVQLHVLVTDLLMLLSKLKVLSQVRSSSRCNNKRATLSQQLRLPPVKNPFNLRHKLIIASSTQSRRKIRSKRLLKLSKLMNKRLSIRKMKSLLSCRGPLASSRYLVRDRDAKLSPISRTSHSQTSRTRGLDKAVLWCKLNKFSR